MQPGGSQTIFRLAYLGQQRGEILALGTKIGCNRQVTTNGSSEARIYNKTLLRIAGLTALLAVFNHGYLLLEHYDLNFGEPSGQGLCNISDYISCAAVSASSYAEFLGVPMAMWGMAANAVFFLFALWGELTGSFSDPAAQIRLKTMSFFIAAASLVMGTISTLVIGRICPFCILAYLLSFATFACTWLATRQSSQTRSQLNAEDRKAIVVPLLVAAAAAALMAFISNDAMKKSYIAKSFGGTEDLTPMIQEALQTWTNEPEVKITPVAALIMGASDANAKMVITEFADFRCSHCKHAAPVFKAFVAGHPDVQLRFEAWPLDGECNASIPSPNGASCLLARAVNCVEKISGHGWAAHEYVYEHQEQFVSSDAVRGALADIAGAASTDPAQVKTCADSAEAIHQIQQEAAVGSNLNLSGTPSVYVNGKKLPFGQNIQVLSEVRRRIVK